MRPRALALIAVPSVLLAAAAVCAQPRIVSFGNGTVPLGVNTAGTLVTGSGGGSAQMWTVSAGSVNATPLTGSTSAARISDNGLFFVSETPNEGALGGFPTNATMTSIWSSASPGWVDLPPLLPDPAGGITGSRNSGGLHSHRDISATGQWIVGQANTAPAGFAGFVWDAASNTCRVLPTEINPSTGRYHDGRALAVSADGNVIVGGQQPNVGGSARALVWRWNPTTMQYDRTFLDRGSDPTTMAPNTSSVDNMHINAAGTKIVGTSIAPSGANPAVAGSFLTRWDWNPTTEQWDRVLLYEITSQATISSWQNDPGCAIPPQFIPAGMSDDGNVVTGILVYSTCGSFIRGGFLWINDASGGTAYDLYDYLVAHNTPGIADFGPLTPGATVFNPPRLGWANGISSDGQTLVGYGGPQSAFGPGWVVNLGGGGCVPPFITAQPQNDTFSNCNSLSISVSAGGSGPIAYQWFKDGQPLSNGATPHGSTIVGATSNAFSVTLPRPQDAGMYSVEITGACGAPVVSNTVSVTVDPAAITPTNDTCATATAVSAGTNVLGAAQNVCAAFVDDSLTAGCETSKADLWYVWTPAASGAFRIETCGANFDTVLSVFSACDGIELACNDDYEVGPTTGCSSNRSRIGSIDVTAGVPLYIRVAAWSGAFLASSSSVNLSINPTPATPANNECSNAAAASIGANAFDTTEATNDWFSTCSAALARDVWFVFNAPGAGSLTLSTCGTAWNTLLSVHDACFGGEIACNDNTSGISGCSSQHSRIESIPVAAGSSTYIRVTGSAISNFGAGTLTVSFTPAPCLGNYNGDGSVDLLDLLAFNADWSANLGQNVTAGSNGDYNGNGTVDLLDLLAFNADWSANLGQSCP